MVVVLNDRPTRRPFKRTHRSSPMVPSTPPPRPMFKKPLQLTPDSTASMSASSESPVSKSFDHRTSTFKLTNTKGGSLLTPETTPSKSGEKRKYSGIFAIDSDSDDDNDDLSHIPVYPSKLKSPRKTYRDYSQLQTPSPTPKRIVDRKGAEIPTSLHRALITPSPISPLFRSNSSNLAPKTSGTPQHSSQRNRRAHRATAPSPSPTPSLSTSYAALTPNSSSQGHAPVYSGRKSYTSGTGTGISASSFSPPQTKTSPSTPSSQFPQLDIGISPAELTRISELILKRTPWDEIAVYVASNRSGTTYRYATEQALTYVVDLMHHNETGCTLTNNNGRARVVNECNEFSGNADGCCDFEEQDHSMISEDDDDDDGYENVFGTRVQVPGGWRERASIKEESTDEEEEEEEWYGCEE